MTKGMNMKRRTFVRSAAGAAMATLGGHTVAQTAPARTLRFVPQANLTVLDPIFTSASVTRSHGYLIYDTLFGAAADDSFRPQMAAGYSVTEDGRTYAIRLRDGLKFHDGEPVRAQDCVVSLRRWTARDVVGQTVAQFVDGWGVQDDRTIRITLKQKLPIFMELIGRGGASVPFIMPEHVAATDPFKPVTETIGSGPFKFVKGDFVAGARIVYERNVDYVPRQEPADGTAGGKVVYFDRVEWHVIPDPATAAAALQAGEVDWYEQVQPDLIPMLRRNPDITVDLALSTGYMGLLRFNQLVAPFDNAAIRRAVMMAVNQSDYMVALTGNEPGAWRVCKSMLTCGSPYAREIGAPAMPADLDKARSALGQAGYRGENVVILHPVDLATIAPMDEVTFDLLKKLGMNAELAASDFGTVTQRRTSKAPIDKGGWSILHTWGPASIMGTPIANQFIRGLGASGFPGWVVDDTIEQMIRQWVLAADTTERNALSDAIQARAFETVPMIPLGQFQIHTAFARNLVGHTRFDGALFWNLRRA
jgi:peptide/nickel transport system substrate-binding protein